MASAAEIKERIESIKETKKVTDAMYMLSSVKMRKALVSVEHTSRYFEELKAQISTLFEHIPETKNRYFSAPLPKGAVHARHGILLITSDKGLAGTYNSTALSVAEEYMLRHPETTLFIVGEYGRQYFRKKKIAFVESFDYGAEFPSVYEARHICADLLEYFDEGRLDEINIIYTDFKYAKPSECKRNVLLPLDKSRFNTSVRQKNDKTKEYIPGPDAVLSGIIPGYLTGFIYSSLVDSFCSEQQARMQAMSTAGDNAGQMLLKLKVEYNRLRQAAITREITEITSGAKAQRAHKNAGKKEAEN